MPQRPSPDKDARLAKGWGWWADEEPSEEIKARAEASLEAAGWKVDVVLSHAAPASFAREILAQGSPGVRIKQWAPELWLEQIEFRLEYKIWFCGHYHRDFFVPSPSQGAKFRCVNYDILELALPNNDF